MHTVSQFWRHNKRQDNRAFTTPLKTLLSVLLIHSSPCLSVPEVAYAPISSQNRSPLKQVYAPPQPQYLASGDNTQFEIQHSLYNSSQRKSVSNSAGQEQLILDGELHRTDLRYARRLSKRSSFSVELPWVYHGGGHLDSTIETWHEWFGLPNGNRHERPQNKLEYLYQRNSETLINIQDSQSGVGDVTLSLQHKLNLPVELTYLWTTSIVLPTGSDKKLTGSGAYAASLTFTMLSPPSSLASSQIGWFASAGAVLYEHRGLLSDYREDMLWFGQAGMNWRWTDWLVLKAQVESQSSLYRSILADMESPGLQLSAGFNARLGKRSSLELFFTEDLDVGTAPDFGVGAKLSYSH